MTADEQQPRSFPTIDDGRYEYLAELGKGMAGQVFKARDTVLRKNVVIKTLHSDMSSGEELQRFQREAKAFSSLDHPHILKILDFGLSDDQVPYLVMEFVEGRPLDLYLKEHGVFQGAEALALTAQICEAMQHAHSRKVLHRDLKPSNLLVVEDKRENLHIYILDFGLAKVTDARSAAISTLTKPGQLLGTAEYMSPEQASALPCTEASDIYSVGCILFEMVSGEPPFHARALLEVIRQQKEAEPPVDVLRRICPDIDVAAIVQRALKKRPEERFSSMAEMSDAIAAALDALPPSQGTIARAFDESEPESESEPEEVPAPAETQALSTRKLKPEVIVVAAGLLALLIFTILAFVITAIENKEAEKATPVTKSDLYELADGADLLKGSLSAKRLILSRAYNADQSVQTAFSRRKDVRAVDASYSDLSDQSIPYMKRWNVFSLILTATRITDKGVMALKDSSLRHLCIDMTPNTTPTSIEVLPSLHFLRSLRIGNGYLEDRDLEPLAHCTQLLELTITASPKLSDRCLEYVAELPLLQTLKVGACAGITESGVASYRRSHPSVAVTYSGAGIPMPTLSDGIPMDEEPLPVQHEILD